MAHLVDIVRIGKALSDRTRIRILAALGVKDLCVCELTELVGPGQPAVSRHLGILRDAGLVEDVRDGKWVNYSLNVKSRDRRMARLLEMVSEWLPDDETLRKDALKVRKVSREVLCRL